MLRVEVEWIDSGMMLGGNGWTDISEIREKAAQIREPVITCGILMGTNDDTVVVAVSLDPSSGAFYGAQAIFRPNIKAMRILRSRRNVDAQTFTAPDDELLQRSSEREDGED